MANWFNKLFPGEPHLFLRPIQDLEKLILLDTPEKIFENIKGLHKKFNDMDKFVNDNKIKKIKYHPDFPVLAPVETESCAIIMNNYRSYVTQINDKRDMFIMFNDYLDKIKDEPDRMEKVEQKITKANLKLEFYHPIGYLTGSKEFIEKVHAIIKPLNFKEGAEFYFNKV